MGSGDTNCRGSGAVVGAVGLCSAATGIGFGHGHGHGRGHDRERIPQWVLRELGDLKEECLERNARGEPWEYILGKIDFYGCQFVVDKRALIPRCETELLVEHVVQRNPEGVLWDVCTGSGCIGIALKKRFPSLKVSLSDLSPDAISLAIENCQLNKVELTVYHGDLLKPFHGKKADWIVCNPPYVSEAEYKDLDSSVKDFEPKMALVGKENGFEFYQRLANEAPLFLNPGGHIFLEIGYSQGKQVKKIFNDWHDPQVIQDFSGQDRFFLAQKIPQS